MTTTNNILLHNSPYQEIIFDKEHALFLVTWFAETKEMSDERYIRESLIYLEKLLEEKPKLALFDTRELDYPITPDIQEWYDAEITIHEKEIFKKQAVCMPNDSISKLSVHLLLEEENNSMMEIRMFDEIRPAKEWLLN